MPNSCENAERADTPAPPSGGLALLPTARLIATALLVGIAIFAVPAGAGTAAEPAAPALGSTAANDTGARLDDYDRAMLAELNRVRAKFRLSKLSIDARITRAADAHSRAQARQGAIAHGAWNGRVARAAGHPRSVGEVIAWRGPTDPTAEVAWVVRGWLDSPTHRPVLLDRDFRRVGIGRALGVVDGTHAAVYTVDYATAR